MSQLETQIRIIFGSKSWGVNFAQSWLNGKFTPSFYEYFAVQQFILLNIKNVTLKLMNVEDVGDMLEKIGKQSSRNTGQLIYKGITNGIVDTGCYLNYALQQHFKQFHVSPSVQSGYFVIVTPLSPDSRPSEQFDILGLNGYVWIAITVSIIALSFLLPGIKDATKGRVWSVKIYVSHSLSYIWYFTADLLQNAQALETAITRVRFLILGWIMASSILMKCYSSNLKGGLLVSTNPKINSINDLVKRKDIIPLSWRPCMISHSIRESPRSEYQLLRQAIEQRKLDIFYDDYNNAGELVWNGKYAHFMYGPYLNSYLIYIGNKLRENDKKVYVGDTKYDQNYSFLFYNKNLSTTILERVDYLTTRFVETDQLFPLKSINSFKSRKYMYQPGNQWSAVTPLTAHFLWPVFKIWIVGIASSILLAMIELISLMIHA